MNKDTQQKERNNLFLIICDFCKLDSWSNEIEEYPFAIVDFHATRLKILNLIDTFKNLENKNPELYRLSVFDENTKFIDLVNFESFGIDDSIDIQPFPRAVNPNEFKEIKTNQTPLLELTAKTITWKGTTCDKLLLTTYPLTYQKFYEIINNQKEVVKY